MRDIVSTYESNIVKIVRIQDAVPAVEEGCVQGCV